MLQINNALIFTHQGARAAQQCDIVTLVSPLFILEQHSLSSLSLTHLQVSDSAVFIPTSLCPDPGCEFNSLSLFLLFFGVFWRSQYGVLVPTSRSIIIPCVDISGELLLVGYRIGRHWLTRTPPTSSQSEGRTLIIVVPIMLRSIGF